MAEQSSHTGRALQGYQGRNVEEPVPNEVPAVAETPATGPRLPDAITIHHAREHNLKNVDIRIPRNKLSVLTGLSGSGKSTVAFDIVFNEGQRRYLESLNAYARQFCPARLPAGCGRGLRHSAHGRHRATDQPGGRKSTVATMTEVYHFLRLLFVKLGTQHCPECHVPIDAQTPEVIRARILREARNRNATLLAPMVVARKGYYTDLGPVGRQEGF